MSPPVLPPLVVSGNDATLQLVRIFDPSSTDTFSSRAELNVVLMEHLAHKARQCISLGIPDVAAKMVNVVSLSTLEMHIRVDPTQGNPRTYTKVHLERNNQLFGLVAQLLQQEAASIMPSLKPARVQQKLPKDSSIGVSNGPSSTILPKDGPSPAAAGPDKPTDNVVASFPLSSSEFWDPSSDSPDQPIAILGPDDRRAQDPLLKAPSPLNQADIAASHKTPIHVKTPLASGLTGQPRRPVPYNPYASINRKSPPRPSINKAAPICHPTASIPCKPAAPPNMPEAQPLPKPNVSLDLPCPPLCSSGNAGFITKETNATESSTVINASLPGSTQGPPSQDSVTNVNAAAPPSSAEVPTQVDPDLTPPGKPSQPKTKPKRSTKNIKMFYGSSSDDSSIKLQGQGPGSSDDSSVDASKCGKKVKVEQTGSAKGKRRRVSIADTPPSGSGRRTRANNNKPLRRSRNSGSTTLYK